MNPPSFDKPSKIEGFFIAAAQGAGKEKVLTFP